MNDRASQILEAVIQEFIDTGEPVSSGSLYNKYDFGIKPAMIRLELDALEDGGYLEQPYHSAGRIPTDRGYEFYATRALAATTQAGRVADRSADPADAERHQLASRQIAAAHRTGTALRDLLERRKYADLLAQLSSELGLLSVAMDMAADEVYKTGLEALFENLNFQDRDEMRSVIRDFEAIDERLPRASEKMIDANKVGANGAGSNGPQVFIGKKSPVTDSDNLSVIGGNYRVGNTVISIFAIGPKRMDYKKTIRVFRSL
jgi:transcriptional regulator of heat shock response